MRYRYIVRGTRAGQQTSHEVIIPQKYIHQLEHDKTNDGTNSTAPTSVVAQSDVGNKKRRKQYKPIQKKPSESAMRHPRRHNEISAWGLNAEESVDNTAAQ